VLHVEDVGVDAAVDVVYTGIEEAAVDPVGVAFASQPPLVGYRWVDWACRHS
jgi:hypothetical protein